MKVRYVLSSLLCAVIGFGVGHWVYFSKPRTITVAFNGWHGRDFLKAGCVPLQREFDRVESLSVKDQATLIYLGKKFTPCLRPAEEMNIAAENELVTAFAANPACVGIKVVQGFYDPRGDAEANRVYSSANYRLSLDLVPSSETGEVSLQESQWSISPRTLSGSLSDLDKATTQICRIAKAQGAQ